MSIRKSAPLLLTFLVLLTPGLFAGLVVDANTTIDMMGMGEMKITVTQSFTDNKSYTKSNSADAFGRSVNTSEIVNLEKGLQYVVMPDKKSYAEIPFADIKEMSAASDTVTPQSGGYTWSIDHTKLEATENIAGIECHGVVAVAIGISESDPTDSVVIEFKQYYADKFAGSDELTAFREAYQEKTGLNDQLISQLKGNPIMSSYGVALEKIADKLEQITGTPLKTEFALSLTKNPMPTANTEGMTNVLSIINEITSLKSADLSDSLFTVPEDFTKTSMQSLMQP